MLQLSQPPNFKQCSEIVSHLTCSKNFKQSWGQNIEPWFFRTLDLNLEFLMITKEPKGGPALLELPGVGKIFNPHTPEKRKISLKKTIFIIRVQQELIKVMLIKLIIDVDA